MKYAPLSLFLLILVPASAGAMPAGVTRVLRTLDFEERRLGNHEDLPMHWVKVERPGFPRYVNGLLATDRKHGGEYSFRFDLNGGSLLYRYGPGQLPVRSGAHYRVEVYCQTTVLPDARARLTAYFADADGRPIPRSERHSELYAARKDDEPWKKLFVELSPETSSAASLVLELGLLQPSQYSTTALGQHSLFAQDIHGSAWFDDLSISQVPQITLSTERPGNIFRAGDRMRLDVLVDDLATDDLEARLELTDAEAHPVYQRSGTLAVGAPSSGADRKRMAVDLPDLKPGWYEAKLAVSSQGQELGRQTVDLVRLTDDLRRSSPDPRLGVNATGLPFEGWGELPDVLPYLSAGRVKLAVWSAAGDVEEGDAAAFDDLLQRLQQLGIAPTGCLLDLPPSVAKKVGGNDWTKLLTSPREAWQPQLAFLLSRHANHLNQWQIGADGSDAFVAQPRMREVYRLVYQEFAGLIDRPDLAMPWPAWYDSDGELPATVALSVPATVLPAQLPLYIQDLHGASGHNLSLSLGLLDRERYGREAQIRDLAQRVIFALSADAKRIDLPLPFTVRRDSNGALAKQPQELLMIERTLAATLGGSTFRGRVPLGEGIEAFLFDHDGQGVLALWDRGNVPGVKRLPLNFGDRPVSIDLWGNVTPLLAAPSEGANEVRLTVGPMPQFLVDIDGAEAQLRASISFDRPLLESSFEPHPRHVRFTNPYRQAISGTLRLTPPAGWTFNPPTISFSLNPGETLDREVSVSFPYNSIGGTKTVLCEFAVQGERSSSFTVPVTLKLGLSDVGMQSLALRDGNDVVVQEVVTNYGEAPIDYTAFATCPGAARQERLVNNLAPGHTTLKRYRFTNVDVAAGTKVRVGLKEVGGIRVLNDEVPVE